MSVSDQTHDIKCVVLTRLCAGFPGTIYGHLDGFVVRGDLEGC
jgi:hypothetical protein